MIAPLGEDFKRHIVQRLYHGICYPLLPYPWKWPRWVIGLWRRCFCKSHIGWHLWNETLEFVDGSVLDRRHYLLCDACGLRVYIEHIEGGVEGGG